MIARVPVWQKAVFVINICTNGLTVSFHYCMGILSSAASMAGPFLDVMANSRSVVEAVSCPDGF